eukprot:256442-Chlamydomonas_euryale.AAC.2
MVDHLATCWVEAGGGRRPMWASGEPKGGPWRGHRYGLRKGLKRASRMALRRLHEGPSRALGGPGAVRGHRPPQGQKGMGAYSRAGHIIKGPKGASGDGLLGVWGESCEVPRKAWRTLENAWGRAGQLPGWACPIANVACPPAA